MADKGTPYFELRDAMALGACPLCFLGRRSSARYLETLNYEGVNDPGMREALVAARGLCNSHAWQFTRLRGSPLGVALTYRHIIQDLLRVIDQQQPIQTQRGRGRRGMPTLIAAAQICPACQMQRVAEQQAGRTLLDFLQEPEIVAGFSLAGGLCLSHLQQVISEATDEQAQILLGWQSAIYQELSAQLSEFIRKQDYRFQHEPLGIEAHSWTKAVACLVGLPQVE